MKDLIARIKDYRQELLDYEAEIRGGVQASLPLIDTTLERLANLGSIKCPFCQALAYPIDKAMQTIKTGLSEIFDLPTTWPGGGFINEISWIKDQDEAMRCGAETEWFCTECDTGKLAGNPDEENFRFRWNRQNLPKSEQAIASRILKQFPLVTEMALSHGYAMHTWYILYDDDWYISLGRDETFVERWGLIPKELAKSNGPIPGYIYLLHCEGWYKIGRTTQKPEDRMAQIDTAMPFETTLIHAISVEDSGAVEQRLHAKFSDKRWKGEWFKLDEADVKYIKGLGAMI